MIINTEYYLFDTNDRIALLGKNDFEINSCLP